MNGKFTRDITLTGLPTVQGEGDLTFRNSDGMGFLTSQLDANRNPVNDFYQITITEAVDTGTAVRIGSTGVAIDALAFSDNGTLYGIGQADATLYTIDPGTGATTAVGSLGVDMNSPVSGMAFVAGAQPGDPSRLVAAIDDRLFQIDVTTGAATPVKAEVYDFGIGSSISGLVAAPGAGAVGNMAARVAVGTGDNVGIGGFIIRGTPDKPVILRGIGPSLTKVPGALADPVIELFDSNGMSLEKNDNWMDSAEKATILSSGLAPGDPKESAIARTLPAGTYTVVLSGAGATSGIGLVEIYDADPGNGSRLGNISSRGFVSTGDKILIGGLIISGSGPQRVAVRALGPDLTGRGVANALADPSLDIRDANGTSVGSNDNFATANQTTELAANGLTPGDPRDSAFIRDFVPGNYTALVTGVGGTGVALVEFYNLTVDAPVNLAIQQP